MNTDNPREQWLDSWLALKGENPTFEGPIQLPVLSGSMLPDFPVGSTLHIKKTEGNRCHPGDVIVYRDNDRLVAHRLLLRVGLGSRLFFFEKGDTNDRGRWIPSTWIKGLVTSVVLPESEISQDVVRQSDKASRSLWADFIHRVLAPPRKIKQMIFPGGEK
ncbi:MAG: hypothetical protein GY780_04265 [bacterium]|nr:hypothetical protein [bacterium]